MQQFLTPKDYTTVETIFAHPGIQERLKGYNYDPDFYPRCSWLNRSVPSPQSILETVALMRAEKLSASIVLPSCDEAANIGKTLEQIIFFRDFELGSIGVYDNSSRDNTREIVQAMNVPLFKAEEKGAQYNIPDEIHHKGTNLWFGIIDALRTVKDPTKHIVLFADTDVGLSVIELMQLLRVFSEKPGLKLVLPFVTRLTKRGQEDGNLTSGGRASKFTWGPMRDTLLSLYVPDIIEHPAQLAGIYGANLEFLANIDIPHGYGVETAIQTEAYISAYRNGLTANEVIQFVPCGVYSQTGQGDHGIRLMSHDIAHELMSRVNALKMLQLSDILNAKADISNSCTSAILEQLQSMESKCLSSEIPQSLSEATHIRMRRKLLADHLWKVTNGKVDRLDCHMICRVAYYLPPPGQYLKEFTKAKDSCRTNGSDK
ncbi:unnamed protein product [Rotaria sp. Silwood1]|nr:unnamed protein product [Rotaria sp. Silwood1]CAF4677993.1 unnamed protein product [Rotaria sp. Silwood1]